jgi:flagellum-specific ATP synthase
MTSPLREQIDAARSALPLRIVGTVQGLSGLTIDASDLALPIGSTCHIHSYGGATTIAETIGFKDGRTLLMPLSPVAGVARGDRIENVTSSPRMWCSDELLGRVLNGRGEVADGKGPLKLCKPRSIEGRKLDPLERVHIDKPISTSVRAIDGLHTCGLGQRMGIFSGPGVGKSTLLSSIARHTGADVSVVALIGERGKEVQDFIANTLGEEGMRRCVLIVSTGDDPPLLRVRAAKVACTVAEYFRDRGLDVLLLMDSLTRLCQAQRLIGLAAKEPPATKGLPPSVFSLLPEILERAGRTKTGSITGFYTVLVEGDDFDEPIPDAVKGITDGHLWLSRSLANRGHFPAIDVLQSISRVRGEVTDKDQLRAARRILSLVATYNDIEDLVNIGAYVPGANVEYDLAVQARPKITQYLQQEPAAPVSLEVARKQILDLCAWTDQMEKAVRAQGAKTAASKGLTSGVMQ